MNPRREAARILHQTLEKKGFANRLLDSSCDKLASAPRDRALLTELVYGVLRHLYRLDAVLDKVAKKGIAKMDPNILYPLRVALYQMLFLDRIPAHALVSEAVNHVRKSRGKNAAGFANALLRKLQREPALLELEASDDTQPSSLSILHSHPTWLIERYFERLGPEQTLERLSIHNTPAPLTLRVNTLWGTRDDLITALAALGAEASPSPYSPLGVHLHQFSSFASLLAQLGSAFIVQDEAAQLPALCLEVEGVESILDACAAPGVKTTQLAMLAPDANITSLDIHEGKCQLIRDNCARLKIDGIQILTADCTQPLSGCYDRILCDAPCSALGLLRKQPEIRYRRSPRQIKKMAALQRKMLSRLAAVLNPGGLLVYAVCTDTREETDQVLATFLEQHPEFMLAPWEQPATSWSVLMETETPGTLRTCPERHNMDAFFIARLRRKA